MPAKTDELLIELRELSYHDPIIHACLELHYYHPNEVSIIDAAITACILLSKRNKRLTDELLDMFKRLPPHPIVIKEEDFIAGGGKIE